jgi:hypothetical protein
MLKANELRIGNLIIGLYEDDCENVLTEICTVLGVDSVGFSENKIWVETEKSKVEKFDSFEGIPITEEWLLKLGFKFVKSLMGYYKGGHEVALFKSGVIEFHPFEKENYIYIKYIHELQNLFFALTGKELQQAQ